MLPRTSFSYPAACGLAGGREPGERLALPSGAKRAKRDPWKRKLPRFPWLMASVAVGMALAGLQVSGDAAAPRNLICYRNCCDIPLLCPFNCSWEGAQDDEVRYTLNLWYHNEEIDPRHETRDAGKNTYFPLDSDELHLWENITIWVESRVGNAPPRTSGNLTLVLDYAVKFQAPSTEWIAFSRSKTRLVLKWRDSHSCHSFPWKTEARLKQATDADFSQICASEQEKGAQRSTWEVSCDLEKNTLYEVQVRHCASSPYSYWSNWSGSIFVPVEILLSPEVNYKAGPLSEDGRRNVTLKWESPSKDQGEVTYTLAFLFLPCQCLLEAKYTTTVRNQTAFRVALSGAAYNVSLQASNTAGRAAARSLWLPPEQGQGPGFLDTPSPGWNFSASWEIKPTSRRCFEKHPLGTLFPEQSCSEGEPLTHSEELQPGRCYRLAVHLWDSVTKSWSTLRTAYFFHQNDTIRVRVTKATSSFAVIQWEVPRNLSTCPGALKGYIVCCQDLQEGTTTYYSAAAAETTYTLQNLKPNTAYLVGLRASDARDNQSCRAKFRFHTGPTDSKQLLLVFGFLFPGGTAGLLAAGIVFRLGRKRIKRALCPALPSPANTEAITILGTADKDQALLRWGLMESHEPGSPSEPVIIERLAGKEEPAEDVIVDSAGLPEETTCPKEGQATSGNALPSEYKAQGLLASVEEKRGL